MITINKTIQKVVPSRNPILVNGTTDNFVLNPGQNQLFTIECPFPPDEGEYWTLRVKDTEFDIIWRDVPNQSGFEIQRNIFDQNEANKIAEDQIDNIPNFVLYGISTFVIFRPGNNPFNYFELVLSVSWENADLEMVFSSNPMNPIVSYTGSPASIREIRSDFRIVCSIYDELQSSAFPNTFRFTPPHVLDSNPNDNSEFGFNLTPALDQMVSFFKAPLTAPAFFECVGSTRFFFFRLEEQFAENGRQMRRWPLNVFPQNATGDTKLSDHDGTYFLCARGKMPLKEFSETQFMADYVDLGPGKKFLTHRPRVSTLHRSEPVWLYYLMDESNEVYLHVKLFLANGSTDETVLSSATLSGDSDKRMHGVSVGIANNASLESFIDSRDIIAYEVWLEAEQSSVMTQISEKMKFILEDRNFEEMNFIIFENPLGGQDTFRVAGNVIFTDSSSGEIVHLVDRQLKSESFFEMINTKSQGGFVVFSGFRKRIDEIEWGKQVLNSNHVWFLRHGEERAVLVQKDEKNIRSTSDSIYSLEFNLKLAHYD